MAGSEYFSNNNVFEKPMCDLVPEIVENRCTVSHGKQNAIDVCRSSS